MENTIFFGNGINLLDPKNITWSKLLTHIKESNLFNDGDLPNTMIYERIILDRPSRDLGVLKEEYAVKEKISILMNSIQPNKFYSELYSMNAENYITTNYDYAFIDSIKNLDETILPVYEYSTEDVYSLRRLKRIPNRREKKKNFWQIHGEIRRPATIMLGLDHYCGEIGKIDQYTKGSYKYIVEKEEIREPSIMDKFKNNNFNDSSWIELFFMSNVHILGFSLKYEEIDIWWILNKRARLKKGNGRNYIKNEIFFYCDKIDDHMRGILKSMDVTVVVIELGKGKYKYVKFYENIMVDLKTKLV